MSVRKWVLTGFALICGASAVVPAAAQAPNAPGQQVERSRNTYHVAVCPRGNPHGTVRCFAHVVTDERGNPFKGPPNTTPAGYGPADLRDAYAITTDGTTTIAIVDAFGYSRAEQDLAAYRAKFNLPPCTSSGADPCFRKLNQNGQPNNYPRDDIGWSQEAALDLDMASAMCPGCKLILVEATSNSFANLAAAVNTAAGIPGVTVISNSYGGGEAGSSSYASAYNHPGKAVTVSTGDSGYGVEFPASSPDVIAVGGTRLVRNSSPRGWGETVWSGGGSGCSSVYDKPFYQTDGQCTKRMGADVSAVADPNTGVAVYGPVNRISSGWLVFGGTSVSAPLIGGIYGVTGHTPTGANTIWSNANLLNDITSGNNGNCAVTYFCTAGAGYDGPTGNGTPSGPGPF